ncbi:hypothetical protein N657DRAFT_667013 [Parathielavia appendiculata]|uniref:Uncharacterized protein n=1 Tax=Parathielavia appendiculata TaxID=2587402 RepID=A0AAN6YYF4_9PEZI|nr:hypothetical protein N657DRAFT_667013 [Parathielavia appendiculata]
MAPLDEDEDIKPNLSKASFQVIRIYFDPPEPRNHPRTHFPWIQKCQSQAESGSAFPLLSVFGCGAYPAVLRCNLRGWHLFAPNVHPESWLKLPLAQSVHSETISQGLEPPSASGVIILRLAEVGPLVISWGQLEWFAVLTWKEIAEKSGLVLSPARIRTLMNLQGWSLQSRRSGFHW